MRISDDNFTIFCMHHYDNVHCVDISELEEDLRRIKALRKLFKRYKLTGELRNRVILNNFVIMYNVFGSRATDILFLKLEEYSSYMVPYMKTLNYLPATLSVNGRTITTSSIEADAEIEEQIQELLKGAH